MRRLLLASAAALMLLPMSAKADVIIDDHLSGTGDNVVFNALTSTRVVGAFNGQHTGLVDFDCLAGCGGFIGAQNGNDLKIANFQTLNVAVFQNDGVTALATATDVFSIIGTGDVTVFVTANETNGTQKLFTFDLTALFGPLGNGQNGFTLSAINGETIDHFRLVDVGGTITDFEHYRIDVAAPRAVPGPVAGAGIPGAIAAGMFMVGLARRRRKNQAADM
jgi:hypothetical protein